MKKMFLVMVTLFAFAGFAGFSIAGVNINTATQSELEALQGIGPAKARAIIEYREEKGPFASKDDLVNVNGIGPGTINQLRESITVNTKAVASQEKKAVAK